MPTVSIVEQTMRQARRAVAIALLGTAAMTVAMLAERLWSARALEQAAQRYATSFKLAADVRLTEVELRRAAQMAYITGDKHWVERYEELLPGLTQTIEHASLLAPQEVTDRYRAKTYAIGREIDDMRAQALAALNAGSGASARAIFESERYLNRSRLLSDATEELTAATLRSTENEMRLLQSRSYGVAAGLLVLILGSGTIFWRRLTRSLQKSRGSLLDAEERIQRLASSDLLTGLANRAGLHDTMQTAMSRARRHQGALAVLMIDLDRFKPVNDRHGHMVGDLVLKEVARRLSRCLRQSDLRARYGGDEFVVVVEETEGPDTGRAAAERIVERLNEPMQIDALVVSIGASVGIARYPDDAEDDDELLRKADSALYRAKAGDRGKVCLYNAALDQRLAERTALELALREGIAAGQLVPFYQPIVDLKTQQVRSLELLCRWRHPTQGLLGPEKFIALAEESGLIGPLTMSLLRQACVDLQGLPPQWRLSINVAPHQIQDESLVPELLAILGAHDVPPQRLDVELTETALVNDTARARAVILALKAAGMTVTLDDFGTGYSSLSYLAEMTFDKIKIDRSFVRTLHERSQSAKIVGAVVGLSRSLGVETVAEGVETEADAKALTRLGCTLGQGYLYGHPVPAARLVEALRLRAAARAWEYWEPA
ncbi:MAG: EAL domain-containing protein [Burkholderiales bacterium]|nr:EAL domain-containing protein [Burkholderiales bacterium]MDE1925617.1 EAL domain-containing protein [Burkholderiales bacterium]MDE2503393.1 EAL domain-containing protein [Burkholderiales bacterium]